MDASRLARLGGKSAFSGLMWALLEGWGSRVAVEPRREGEEAVASPENRLERENLLVLVSVITNAWRRLLLGVEGRRARWEGTKEKDWMVERVMARRAVASWSLIVILCMMLGWTLSGWACGGVGFGLDGSAVRGGGG